MFRLNPETDMLDEKIAENFLRLVADSQKNGVPEMHFRLWRHASDEIRRKYLNKFLADPATRAWIDEGYLADDPEFDALLKLPHDSLGFLYARHIVDNKLNKTIASDYRRAHEKLEAEGKLEGMPAEVRYAALRGFQLHDILHIFTGYLTTGWGEIALQAFSLAQMPLPYFSIWMATLTAQMTFINPDMATYVMDAISQGWQLGRQAKNLNYEKWELRFAEPIAKLREEYGLPAAGAVEPSYLPVAKAA
jgi:ubiquinone biosynthesis protein COQ4